MHELSTYEYVHQIGQLDIHHLENTFPCKQQYTLSLLPSELRNVLSSMCCTLVIIIIYAIHCRCEPTMSLWLATGLRLISYQETSTVSPCMSVHICAPQSCMYLSILYLYKLRDIHMMCYSVEILGLLFRMSCAV